MKGYTMESELGQFQVWRRFFNEGSHPFLLLVDGEDSGHFEDMEAVLSYINERVGERKELLESLLSLDREMQNMEKDSDYNSEYQAKNREWHHLYDAILDF